MASLLFVFVLAFATTFAVARYTHSMAIKLISVALALKFSWLGGSALSLLTSPVDDYGEALEAALAQGIWPALAGTVLGVALGSRVAVRG